MINALSAVRTVAVTASTGIAALQFTHGQTVHSWSGIGDGHTPRTTVVQNILTDNSYNRMKTNIQNTNALIIDEIGMLSCRNFESVEYICRKVRNSDLLFGGLQVIASGCFKQLPPVPSISDEGKYAFESELFKSVFPHRLHLTEVVRQKERDLIVAVKELCNGTPSEDTINLMKSLKRPLPSDTGALYIFGTNRDCEYLNELKLSLIPSAKKVYYAIDDSKCYLCILIANYFK